jgi:hypothetical protein
MSMTESGFLHAGREAGASWKAEYSRLADEIRVRHYSSKTLKTYRGWAQKFQTFTHSKSPALLSTNDVKEFLTSLAVKQKVSATTQNQAFNSLLFFYRHILRKEFGKVDGVVRAKRKPYIPVVLSREEIDAILRHLASPYELLANFQQTPAETGKYLLRKNRGSVRNSAQVMLACNTVRLGLVGSLGGKGFRGQVVEDHSEKRNGFSLKVTHRQLQMIQHPQTVSRHDQYGEG